MSNLIKINSFDYKSVIPLVQPAINELSKEPRRRSAFNFRGYQTTDGNVVFPDGNGSHNKVSDSALWKFWMPSYEDESLLTLVKDFVDINKITRIRLSHLPCNVCFSWHQDITLRIHIPLITNSNCLMLIEKELLHLETGYIYAVNTLRPHTAFNCGNDNRYHLLYDYHGDWNDFA